MVSKAEGGQVYSIRLSKQEVEKLRDLAERYSIRVSDVIHAAVESYSTSIGDLILTEFPGDSKVTIFSEREVAGTSGVGQTRHYDGSGITPSPDPKLGHYLNA